VIEVVVESPAPAAPQVNAHGWRPAAQSGDGAGRVRIDELSSADTPQSESSGAWTVVEAPQQCSAEPLVDAGFLRCEAVFDGIPALVDELAPIPTSESDDAFASEMRNVYALAPQPLASPGSDAPAAPGLMPVPGGAAMPPVVELSPQQAEELSSAAAELHKPVNAITLTTGLAAREPPDLSAATLNQSPPVTIWGEPWPDVKLACYRYVVPFSHRPLYFEQPNLERCGTGCCCLTTYASAAHFFGSVVLLPLHAVLDPPCRCVPTLGDCPTCHPGFGLCPTCNRGT
jgi:hypothetical protein